MSAQEPDQPDAASRPSKETNSVNSPTAGKQDLSKQERIHERVLEFEREYDDLADLPLSRTHGRKLRRIVTEPEWTEEFVEPEGEFEDSFSVSSLDRRAATDWADAVQAFLRAHVEYDGMLARFANSEGDTFDIPLVDAWGENYSKKEYARARALQRQMSGGERPSGGEAIAAWSETATGMTTLTGSSVPGGERLSPVDHLDALHDSFSYDGVRDTLRNVMEYHLGLESHQWGYWLQAEPHGMGSAEENKNPGKNACYTHLHVGIYFDAGAAPGLRKVGSELERVIDKHLEVCDPAGRDAHDYSDTDYIEDDDGPISVNAQVDNLGSYLAAYMGGYTEDLLDKPIEYIAWGALYWSAARRRTSRSKIVNESIRADRCNQRAESDEAGQKATHGENVEWNDSRGLDVVCACCGSGWAIDQNRIEEPVSDEELTDAVSTAQDVSADGGARLQEDDDTEPSLRERWPDADAAASYGESLRHAAIREKVSSYMAVHGPHDPLPQVLGQLGIAPKHREFVQDLLDGEAEIPSDSFDKRPISLTDQWELQAIVDSDGVEHSPGGGGVDTVELHLPRQRLLEQTRLRHDLEKGEVFRCRKCNFSSHNPRQIATCLVDHGITDPQFADYLLKVEDYNGNSRERIERPQPP